MSFSSEAKTELCRVPLSRVCCARAEAYGVLLYCHTFDRREIRIITANDAFAQRLPKLFRRAFSLAFDHVPPEGAAGLYRKDLARTPGEAMIRYQGGVLTIKAAKVVEDGNVEVTGDLAL